MTVEDAKEYLYSFSTCRRVYKFQDIKVNLYIWPNIYSPTATAVGECFYVGCSKSKGQNLFELFGCLKIVYRLDSAKDISSRLDVLYYFIHAFVSHRGLVKGIGNNAGGVDTCHLCLILSHG